jgi:hypothetical protein
MESMNLVKYAGDFWITLADYTQTRDTGGYSDSSSVKSAIRTFVVKQDSNKYIAFRGEVQIKNIIQENRNNPLFNPDDFKDLTRTALIHWSMLEKLNERFKLARGYKTQITQFIEEANKFMESKETVSTETTNNDSDNILEGRSSLLRQLRNDLAKTDRAIEVHSNNREKIQAAINAIESLELEEA